MSARVNESAHAISYADARVPSTLALARHGRGKDYIRPRTDATLL